jgi:hypothetical protein
MCGFIYKADSDHSLKGKNVFSADECNIGTVVSSLGKIKTRRNRRYRKNKKIRNSSNRNKKGRGTINYS